MPYLARWWLAAMLTGTSFAVGPSLAENLQAPVCRVVLLEEQTDLEDLTLDLDLLRSEAAAMEQIFKLVDSLWKEEAIERIIFLEAKHDHDVARLAVEEGRLRVSSQKAVVEPDRREKTETDEAARGDLSEIRLEPRSISSRAAGSRRGGSRGPRPAMAP
jgi:hypothetical protein